MMMATKKGHSSRTASYVQAEVFHCIRSIAKQINCPVLNRIVSVDIYARSAHLKRGIGDEYVIGDIVGFDVDLRHRIVRLIKDNLQGNSPFKMSLEHYGFLKDLVEFYGPLTARLYILKSEEDKVHQRIKEFFPDLRNAKPFDYAS